MLITQVHLVMGTIKGHPKMCSFVTQFWGLVQLACWLQEYPPKLLPYNFFVRRRVGERMISACVVPTMKHGRRAVMMWGCFSGDTVGHLFRIQGTLNQHGYHSILQRYAIPSGLCLVGPSFVFQPPGCVTAIWPRRRVMECCIRWPGLHNHPTSIKLRWLGLFGQQSEGKAVKNCSAYVGTPSKLLKKHSRWIWLRECQECAKLSSRQRVTIWRISNIKYILICLTLFGYYILYNV